MADRPGRCDRRLATVAPAGAPPGARGCRLPTALSGRPGAGTAAPAPVRSLITVCR